MAPKGKVYAFEEVSKHNNLKDCWLIISGKVYDVTPFLDDHPGGDDILLSSTVKDVTNDFEDTGHSDSARELMKKYYIGEIDVSTLPKVTRYFIPLRETSSQGTATKPVILKFLIPLFFLGLAFAIWRYTKNN